MNPLRPTAQPAAAAAPAAQTAQSTQAEARRAQLRSAAEAFEAVFLRQMIGSMRQARLAEDPFSSAASEQFRDMADSRLADSMAQQRSFGIAELLLGQFDRQGGAR